MNKVLRGEKLNHFLIDWLSVTSKSYGVSNFIDLLGMSEISFMNSRGAHGYKNKLYYEGVNIHFNGSDDMGVWLELSGKGCRTFETLGHGDYSKIFDGIVIDEDLKPTRLDIAFDDMDGILDISKLANDAHNQNFISKWEYWEVLFSAKGTSIYHGHGSSDARLRFYDKDAEQGHQEGRHWVRCELQMRDEIALNFIKAIRAQESIGIVFLGVVANYLRYLKPNKTDSNKSRWATATYWEKFIKSAAKISLYEKPGMEYSLYNLEKYVLKQAGNAIDTYIECLGLDSFLKKLQKRGTKPNPKYAMIKERAKNLSKNVGG